MNTALYNEHFDHLTNRFDSLMERHGYSRVLIYSGAPIRQFRDDMDYPFKVNPHFKSVVPIIDNPFCWIVWEKGQTPKLAFYQPDDFWHIVQDTPRDFWTSHFDITTIQNPDDAKSLLGDGQHTACLGEINDFIKDWPLGDINPTALEADLVWQRAYKTPYELACIKEANRIACIGHKAAEAAFRAGGSEFEINMAYLTACQQGENEVPYTNIVGLNEHSAILHYHGNSPKKLGENRSFLIDAGANCYGYASDITRTYSKEQDKFAELINSMDDMQLSIIEQMTVGKSYTDLHILTHEKLAVILKDFDFINCSPETAVDSGITSLFFPHGLGHLIGLQVHDVGGHQKNPQGELLPPPDAHPFLRCTRTMEANQVFTIEPGLYVIDRLLAKAKNDARSSDINWNTVDQFRPYGGIRIEDNVVTTESGPVNFTREFL